MKMTSFIILIQQQADAFFAIPPTGVAEYKSLAHPVLPVGGGIMFVLFSSH